MTDKRETGNGMTTTEKTLRKLGWMMLGREEGKNKRKDGTKRPAEKGTTDVKDMATLSNAYGYLLNIQTNVRKTHMIDVRLKELEALAVVTQRLIPDSKQRQSIPTLQ